MVKKVVSLVVFIPLAIVLIVLSVANRQAVTLALNPFKPDDALLSLTAPFFVFLFLALMLGLLLGSAATWLAQGKYRKKARAETRQAVRWQAEADRQKGRAEQLATQGLPQISAK
ncbi:DUF1049 domain-containing protein [Rhizobium arsenicireducens]